MTRTLKLGVAALLGVATLAPTVASAQYYGAPPPPYYGARHGRREGRHAQQGGNT